MLHGIYKERDGYALYVNGRFIIWCKYLTDLKRESKQVPTQFKYSDTKTVTHNLDYSLYTKK